MRARVWIVLLVALVLGGCGDEEPVLSARSAEELHAQVAAVRDAAAEGDRAAALKGLDGLAAQVRDLEGEEDDEGGEPGTGDDEKGKGKGKGKGKAKGKKDR